MADEKYSTNLVKTKYVNDSKITDHYAIIPTGQGYENFESLPELQKQIYKVIVKRFLAIFYPQAEYSKIQVTINVEGEKFYTSGKICVNQGFLEILKPNEKKKPKDENNTEKQAKTEDNNLEILKILKKGQEIGIINYEIKEAETSPPNRYNSGSIILAMENAGKLIEEEELREQIKGAGIGTSATRAEIIKKYFDGPYKQENIARYRQMMEDVRIESANMTYRRIGRKKEQQQRTEQDDEYVRRFINNLR